MATKKYIELQEMTDEELVNEIKVTREQYNKLSFDHAVKGLDNPLELREVRRDIARLLSEEKRREMKAFSEAQLAKRSKIRNRRK